MKRHVLHFILLIVAISCTDISAKRDLYGTWVTSNVEEGDREYLIINKDLTYQMQILRDGEMLSDSKISGQWEYGSTYIKEENGFINTITLKPEDASILPSVLQFYYDGVCLYFIDNSSSEKDIVRYYQLDVELDI